jgi:hypothetical protein
MNAVLAAIKLRSMANFRQALAMPGVQIVRLDAPVPNRRTVAVLQSDAVAFRIVGRGDARSWLWFGPARDWSFAGNRATRHDRDSGEPVLIYELHPGFSHQKLCRHGLLAQA